MKKNGKERVKRDVKRLLALTRTLTLLHQQQRKIYEKNGQKFVLVEVIDFINALQIFQRFLNLSYEGIDPRYKHMIEWIRNHHGKFSKEIAEAGFEDLLYCDWVPRHEVQKAMNISSINTIKKWVKETKDLGLIETFYNFEVSSKIYLLKAPVNAPVNDLLAPVNLKALDRWLTGGLIGKMIGLENYLFSPDQPKNPFIDDKTL